MLALLTQLLVFVELAHCARSVQIEIKVCMVHLASSVADRSWPEIRGSSTILQCKYTYQRIRQHLESYYNQKFSYRTVIQLFLPETSGANQP